MTMGQERKQYITQDDLFKFNYLLGAQLSPDGRNVVYALGHEGVDEDREYASIWVLALDTGATRRLTDGRAHDTNPQWSPDGTRIAFQSCRDGVTQLYLMAAEGGEPWAVTSMKQGVGTGPAWSPDGTRLAFTAGPDVDPPILDKPYRVTRHIYRFYLMGYLEGTLQDVFVIAADGGEPTRLTHDDWHNTGPQWSPDGRQILFSATMAPDDHLAFYPRLKAVSLEAEVRDITSDWGIVYSASWSPDSARIVFVGVPRGRPISAKSALWIVDRQGGEPECRSENLTYQVGGQVQPDMVALLGNWFVPRILVTDDGEQAYVRVQRGGALSIYRIGLTGPESWAPVFEGERSCFALNLHDGQLLFGASTLNNPADLYLAAADGSNERRLTDLNAELLAERDLLKVERLLYPSSDGVQVEGWILTPPTGEAPYPTILYGHGGPRSAWGHLFSFDFQMLAGAGYAVLIINQRGSTGYGEEFGHRLIGDWGHLDYDDLMAGVDFVIDKGIADPDRLGVCGLSGGGILTCWIIGQTDRFKAAVPENPITNMTSHYGTSDIGTWYAVGEMGGLPWEIPEVYRRSSAITYAHRCKTPTLLIQSEADYRCPLEQGEQFYTALKANGCTVEMLRMPGADHTASILGPPVYRRAQNEALLDWMNRYVLGDNDGREH